MRWTRRVITLALAARLFLMVPVGSTSAHAAPRIEVLSKSARGSRQALAAGATNPEEAEAFLDDFFEAKMAESHIPAAAIVVVKDGQVLLAKGYGFADLSWQIPVNPAPAAFGPGSLQAVHLDCGDAGCQTGIARSRD